jgi:hypothetical protein
VSSATPILEQVSPRTAPDAEASRLVLANNYLWAIHGALLLKVGVEATREFWAAHPLELQGRVLGPLELAQHLSDELAFSPLIWSIRSTEAVERFLVERGLLYEEFLTATLRFANGGTWVGARHLLPWLSPLFVPLFRFGDPYRLLLYAAGLTGKQFSPGVICRVLAAAADAASPTAGRGSGGVFMAYPGLADGRVPPWDAAMTTARQLQAGAAVFGLPAFESAVVLSDARAVETIPWAHAAELRADGFYIGGERFGKLARFREFWPSTGYDLSRLDLPDAAVVLMERDYVCPKRQRVVLSAGCAYGAPGYIVRFGWRKPERAVRNFLAVLAAESDGEMSQAEEQARQLNRDYIRAVTPVLLVVFHQVDDSISVNDRHVCRGVPARILYECLLALQTQGKSEFSLRELKRRPELVSHPKNTGLEMRLKRLSETLEQSQCGLALQRSGRGQFRLKCLGQLTLQMA